MSVLYKALEKAARQNARGEPGAMAAADGGGMGMDAATATPPPPLTPRAVVGPAAAAAEPGAARMVIRVLALVFLLISAAVLAAMVFFQDEVETLLAGGADAPVTLSAPTPTPDAEPDHAPAPAPAVEPATAPEGDTPEIAAPHQAAQAPDASAGDLSSQPETAAKAPPDDANRKGEPSAPAITAQPAAAAAAPAPIDDNIAALMAEGAARLGTTSPVAAPPEFEAQAAAAPPPDRLGAEDVLRARRSTEAARAVGAPVTIDAASSPAGLANVRVSSVPQATRETLASGYGALMRGNYAGALNAYDSILEREPDNVPALSGRAAALHKLGLVAQARTAYERVLARQPDNREALTNMITLLGDADPATALTELERLQSVAPDFSPIPAQIGMLHARMGRVGEALGALRRAVSLSPENALYHYNIAVVSDRAGRVADAARAYERVLRLIAGGTASGGLRAQPIRDRLRYLRARL